MPSSLRLVAALSLLLMASIAEAQTTLISNLADAIDPASNTVGNAQFLNSTIGPPAWYAAAFVVPGGSDYTLTSVTLKLENFGGGSGSFFVSIYDSTSTATTSSGTFAAPGSAYTVEAAVAYNDPRISTGSYQDVTFTPSTTITLHAGQTYFVAAGSNTDVTNVSWAYTPSFTYATGNSANSLYWGYNIGTGFDLTSPLDQVPDNNTAPNLFAVSATAVPEPSTYAALAGMAALGLALSRRRRPAA